MKYNEYIKSTKLNAITAYFNFFISSILIFIASPYIIQFLGTYYYGVWKSIQKILEFSSVADGKPSSALKWIVANKEGDSSLKSDKRRAVGAAIKICLFFMPFTILILIGLVYNLPNLINLNDEISNSLLFNVGVILGINILISPLLAIPSAILTGVNKAYKANAVRILTTILLNILTVYVLFLDYGLKGMALVTLFMTMLNAFFIYYVCKKNVSWLGLSKPSRKELKLFFNFSFYIFLWSFIEKLILSSEIIIIGYLIGPEVVSNYTFSTYLMVLVISISIITGSSLTPSIGKLLGQGNSDYSSKIVKVFRELIIAISVFFGAFIILFNKNFITIWVGESLYLGSNSNFILVLLMIQTLFIRSESQVLDLSLNIKNKVRYGAVFSVLSLLLSITFYHLFENKLEAILLGAFLGRFFMVVVFKKMVDKMIDIKVNFKQITFLIITLISSFWLSFYFNYDYSWILFIGFIIIYVLIVLPLLWCFLISVDTKSIILKIIPVKLN